MKLRELIKTTSKFSYHTSQTNIVHWRKDLEPHFNYIGLVKNDEEWLCEFLFSKRSYSVDEKEPTYKTSGLDEQIKTNVLDLGSTGILSYSALSKFIDLLYESLQSSHSKIAVAGSHDINRLESIITFAEKDDEAHVEWTEDKELGKCLVITSKLGRQIKFVPVDDTPSLHGRIYIIDPYSLVEAVMRDVPAENCVCPVVMTESCFGVIRLAKTRETP